jgi:membrane protease YdiL (CAAX protease family)
MTMSPTRDCLCKRPWCSHRSGCFGTCLFSETSSPQNRYPPFAITVFGGALVLTWLYNRSGGSVLLPILMHAMVNSVAAGYIFQMFHSADLTHMWWIYAAAWGIVGGIFAVLIREEMTAGSRVELAPSPETTIEQ